MDEQVRADLERIKQIVIPIGERIIDASKPILSKAWKFSESANFLLTEDSVVLVCSGYYPVAFITKLGRLEFASLSVTSSRSKQQMSDVLSKFEPKQIPVLGSGEVMYFLKKDAKGEGINSPENNVLSLSTPASVQIAESVLQARAELIEQIGNFKSLRDFKPTSPKTR